MRLSLLATALLLAMPCAAQNLPNTASGSAPETAPAADGAITSREWYVKANASTAWLPNKQLPETRGARVALREKSRQKVEGTTGVSYLVETSGFPRGKSYTIYLKSSLVPPGEKTTADKGGSFGGLEADALGKLFLPATATRKEMTSIDLTIHGYLRGEALDVAVIAEDSSAFGSAEAMPFPIDGRDGGCYVFVRPLAIPGEPLFETFGVYGEGFEPNAKISAVERIRWEVDAPDKYKEAKNEVETVEDGSFKLALAHLFPAKGGGDEDLTVSGRSCSVTVQFQWGPFALKKENRQ
jgi:hypothetical protein